MSHMWYAVLGSTPELSLAELSSVLGRPVTSLTPQLAELGQHPVASIPGLAQKLGGTVKILEKVSSLPQPDPETTLTTLSQILMQWHQDHSNTKVTFALSQLPQASTMPVSASELKKRLAAQGVPSRFLTDQSDHQLGRQITAAAWQGQPQLQELFLVKTGDEYSVLRTAWVQDIAGWAARDRDKPYANRRKGMLPPKTARIMLNLLSPDLQQTPANHTIYDPFCGSGTILLEAATLGYQVVGSDLDPEAVAGTKNNLDWLAQHQPPSVSTAAARVFYHDVGQNLPPELQTVSAVVTEPFLGKPTPNPAAAAGIVKGLGKLYLGAFKRWRHILPPGGEVVMIWPAIDTGSRLVTLDFLIDKLTQLGYSTSLGPIEYYRPQAVVRRHIYKFQLQESRVKS